MNSVKFVIAGLGAIGKRHAYMVLGTPNAEVVALIEPDVQKIAGYPELQALPFFSSLDEFLQADISADVINICTPNGLHAPLAIKALKRKYHVVIEKPMGLSKTECEEVIFTSLQEARQVFVVKQNRYSPPGKWMKQVVSEKTIGEVLMVQINCYWNRDERYYRAGDWKGTLALDGGVLYTQFSHFVDIMYWIFGDIRNIKASFANHTHKDNTEFEDSGLVQFDFVNGGMGCLNYSTAIWDTNMESSITVIGSKGSFKVGGQYMNEIEYCHIKDYTPPVLPPTNPPNDYGPFKGSAANHHYVIENVINTLNGLGTITTNALEGMKVVEIIERIYETRKLESLTKDIKRKNTGERPEPVTI
ncbi:MAG: Gfo/Idh/MocA family oxidoreductase [Sphingobacteriales bacterium]|nr:MAG: Gfo/Idh/MocA family oxidoreductase [Sphingobacteriales bacterium]